VCNDSVTEINFEETFFDNVGQMQTHHEYKVETGGYNSKTFGQDPLNFDVSLIINSCELPYTIQIGVRKGSQLSIYISHKGKYGNYTGFFLFHIDESNKQKLIGGFNQINAFLRDILGQRAIELYGNHLCYQALIVTIISYIFTYTAYKFTICFKTMQREYKPKMYRLSKHALADINKCGKKHHYLEDFTFKMVSPKPQIRCLVSHTFDDLVEAMNDGLCI